MAFDQPTRSRLQRFVGEARDLLAREFTEQLQEDYGLNPTSGEVLDLGRLTRLDDTRRESARLLRETLDYYLASGSSPGKHEALDRIVREQAFTVLNRLCALRMAEARGLLIESVAKGYTSKGFQLYARLAGSALGETGDAYRTYLFSVFDEFALDLAVLFDRFSPQGRLFPREPALLALLDHINHPDLEPLWAEDETIGWVYQYFNSVEERRKMRADSPAPRNSRELAVRNQFFTPRYVVEFLTDNTLGRVWYEMTHGKTVLVSICRYLVRRPAEVFLSQGEAPPEAPAAAAEDLSQEELLKQPVYVPFRPLKDPRDIKMLDPACGSMHFGLYAFDLFEQIYAEAWDLEEAVGPDRFSRSAGLTPLRETYPSRDALLRDVPRLVIEHNIHGIDIDPRAVQIAGLSLWLRAHKSWHDKGIAPAERPRIRRSHVVCAEPMPGGAALLEEFLSGLRETRLEGLIRRVLGAPVTQRVRATPRMADALCDLVRTAWKEMELAGEAGSLLKIEDSLATTVAKGREEWADKAPLFRVTEFGFSPAQPTVKYYQVLPGYEGDFWDRAEALVLEALREYAEQATNGGGYQRRLFAADAARGFAFVDICRKRYDAVLMNPPFGSPPESTAHLVGKDSAGNLYPAFVLRAMELATGFVGVISDRTFVVQQSFAKFRMRITSAEWGVFALVELGWGVLDDADVQVAMYVVRGGGMMQHLFAAACGNENVVAKLGLLANGDGWTTLSHEVISKLPGHLFAHTLPRIYLQMLEHQVPLNRIAILPRGLGSNDANRTYKAWYEVPNGSIGEGRRYRGLCNGGPCSPFYRDDAGVAEWLRRDKKLLVEDGYSENDRAYDQKGHADYFIKGLSFPKQAPVFNIAALAEDAIPTREGKAILPRTPSDLPVLLAYLNSSYVRFFVDATNGLHKQSGPVGMTPVPEFTESSRHELAVIATDIHRKLRDSYTHDEASRLFVAPATSAAAPHWLQAEGTAALEAIDAAVFDLLAILPDDRAAIRRAPAPSLAYFKPSTIDWLSYALGCIVGRWDVRFATGEAPVPDLPDPFAPLPACPPGMLRDSDGLPLTKERADCLRASGEWGYPLAVLWDGILVNDPGHPLDVEALVGRVLQLIWKDCWESVEREACAVLRVRSLRDHFDKPGGFFADHLGRYSKSRRQAPIYWPLSTRSGSYTLWVYYHRLTSQTLYTAVNDLVEPKLKNVSSEANRLRQKSGRTGVEEADLERLAGLEEELKEFRGELLTWAGKWKPDLNDGVQITAAPLYKLFLHRPWRARLKETWEALEAGEYDWVHLALSLWPDRVREKCKADKSLARAHGLEELYVEPPAAAKKKRAKRKKGTEPDAEAEEGE